MKKLLVLLLLSVSVPTFAAGLDFLFESFCYKSPKVQNRNGVFYLPNQQEPFTGENLCAFVNGQYHSKGNIVNGVADGKWTYWHENGQMWNERNYKDGRYHGKQTAWHENGQMSGEGKYINGKIDGKWIEWDKNGLVNWVGTYKDGKCISGDCS
jgi:antitoxin component YwqK of YwqJK toxin-antitoxin module